MPDQRMVQRLVDERPYMLGALGLGIGAMIGLMLPSPLSARGAHPPAAAAEAAASRQARIQSDDPPR